MFSPGGKLLACACDKTLALWDVADPAHPVQSATFIHHSRFGQSSAVGAVGFSPDRRLLATGANTVALWDVADPAHPAQTALVHLRDSWKEAASLQGPINAVNFSPDGRLLAAGTGHPEWVAPPYGGEPSRGAVALWDVTTHADPVRTAWQAGSGRVNAVAFSPDGQLLASGHEGAIVRLSLVTDPAQMPTAATFAGHRGAVLGVAFSPDGRVLASCGNDKTVRLWNVG